MRVPINGRPQGSPLPINQQTKPMSDIGIAGLVLIIINVAVSCRGFTNRTFFESYAFEIDPILVGKDYKRLITSGFLHVSWLHLMFNMLTLYAFGEQLESRVGAFYFLLIYFASLIAGDLLSLFIHRNHGDYSAVGASGAVCGIIFASIALFPDMEIGFFGLPTIKSWLYGIFFVVISIYGIKSGKSNIGHDAHLGGALVGMMTALILEPHAFRENYITILIITLPTILFIYLIITKPHILLLDNAFSKQEIKHYDINHKSNESKVNKQKELDVLLEKIKCNGFESLSAKEKLKLEEYSK